MALLPSVATRVTVELTRYRSAVSEFLAQTLGKSINYLLDRIDAIENALDSAIVSEVIAVNQSVGSGAGAKYTAPAGYTFVGNVLVQGTNSTSQLQMQVNGEVYTVLQGSAGGAIGNAYAFISVPVVGNVTFDASVNANGSLVGVFVRGFIYKNADLTIP
jgi:hypothetical protein